ncbi:MAG: WD40 repeat domain-containing serine/threonine protein kinase [Candidatus Acidiferrales bacterium]
MYNPHTLPLTPGTKLGPYEILSLIGTGGMGEVYRARDGRLGRDVAIKILPASFANDQDRLRRFEQEAQAVAALNHPNLLTVFDVGVAPVIHATGGSGGATGVLSPPPPSSNLPPLTRATAESPYIVSELLEGGSLREKLASGGAMRERKAIDYAIQMARGLAAAHERGIVHRDIKPDNIFITNDGRVKILDFGLAKLTQADPAPSDSDATLGPLGGTPGGAAGNRSTQVGVVMGTLGYMSPEQVRGKPADARSDIFSFGAVVYEMLSGKRAFRGDTSADLMSAILNHEPPDLTATNTEISPTVDRIVHHCLEKDAQQRFQSAGDIAFQLNELSGLRSTSGAEAVAAADAQAAAKAAAAPPPPKTSNAGKFVTVALLALAAGAAAAWFAAKSAYHYTPPTFQQITFMDGIIDSSRFLPDGHSFICAAKLSTDSSRALYIGNFDTPGLRPLNIQADQVESVSPSGNILIIQNMRGIGVGYVAVGTLAQMGLDGGAPRPVLNDVQYATWDPEGKNFAAVRFVAERHTYALEYPPDTILYETHGWLSNPHFSRDGKHIAVLVHPVFGDDLGSVAVFDMQGKSNILGRTYGETQHLAWSPDGKEVWYNATEDRVHRNILAVDLKGKVRTLLSAPGRTVLQDVRADGDVLIDSTESHRVLMVYTPEFPNGRDYSWLDWPYLMRFSFDSKQILFGDQHVGEKYATILRNLDGSPAVVLGPGDPMDISYDGKYVLSRLPTSPEQLMLLPTGTGEPRQITHTNVSYSSVRWLPDGRYFFNGSVDNHQERAYVGDLNGNQTTLTPEGILAVAVSPDGKQMITADSVTREKAIMPMDGGPSKPLPQITPDESVIDFTPDGESVLVRRIPSAPAAKTPEYVSTTSSPTVEIWSVDLKDGKRTLIRSVDVPAKAVGNGLAVTSSRDGKNYAMQYHPASSIEYLVRGLK